MDERLEQAVIRGNYAAGYKARNGTERKDYHAAVAEQCEKNKRRAEVSDSPPVQETEQRARYISALCPMQRDGESLLPPVGKLFLLMTR
ncbi:hypothetical protein PDTA9759_02870 [Phytobacter diazotrophicus]|uniref:Uncharacterized protein n=1 Tax=Phytobacter diazotrophicus TaxID=395631 RepID=A0ABM7VP60_9ENTR|nr:hypothetical protein MRY16398_02860 [Phytobacter sp. MRY16-398]BDD48799.1 hypothetical protein PDTA9734_02860 [Phytobacter diazotrophicus]BEG79831.1 hypothetical protein PDTA9730_02870 [Phytobacter diazotrophicus]BEG85631.1 hypothetical protein PDTA9759_02870 [Phytobacter diazotrophicus]BEG91428.1 hypothetical protein PDTA9832_02870 [Phytobacter diazotrophicus]